MLYQLSYTGIWRLFQASPDTSWCSRRRHCACPYGACQCLTSLRSGMNNYPTGTVAAALGLLEVDHGTSATLAHNRPVESEFIHCLDCQGSRKQGAFLIGSDTWTRTRITGFKVPCPNHWTISDQLLSGTSQIRTEIYGLRDRCSTIELISH